VRPEKLVLEAFGPFADTQTIDFRELGERNFFLIHGPTGAGKTSILDAMCFALFGETSGNERTARQARCDHAAASAATRVTLDFAVGAERYRISREPEYEREKKRGSGKTLQPPRASLWRLGESGDPAREELLASSVNAVGEQVESLLGFGADQFRQVVVLPQGQFRRLLTAASRDREEILSTLFGTALYRRIEEALREARLELERERRDLTRDRDHALDEAGVAQIADLEARRGASQVRLEEIRTRRDQLDAARVEAATRLESANAVARLLAELAEATAARRALEAASPANEAKRRELERARRAAQLESLRRAKRERSEEALRALDVEAAARDRLAQADAALQRAACDLDAEHSRADERRSAEEQLARLAVLRDTHAEQLRSARAAYETAASAEQLARSAADECERRLRGAEEAFGELERRIALHRAVAAQRDARASVLHEREEQERRRTEHDQAQLELAERIRAHRTRADGLEVAASAQAEAEATFEALRHARDREGAAILALGLVDGAPCPVCGSVDHPRPASSEGALPSEGDVGRARRFAEARTREWKEAADSEAEARRSLGEARSRVDLLSTLVTPPQLPGFGGDVASAREELDEAENAAHLADQLEARQRELGIPEARSRSEDARARWSGANEIRIHAEAAIRSAEALVPLELRDPDVLEATYHSTEERVAALRHALSRAEAAAAEAERDRALALHSLEAASRAAMEAGSREEIEAQRLRAALASHGFLGEDDLAAAVRLEEQIASLEREIERHDRSLGAARERETRAATAAEGKEQPDLAALRASAEAAEKAFLAIVEQGVAAANELETTEKQLRKLRDIAGRLEAIDARYAVVGRVAEVAAGDNPLRLPFHRFVLAAQLDLVLDAATHRLREMSGGRYALSRCAEPESRRGTAGLDLEVFDAYTGTARAAATLSGGEGFLASLALALGLADMVQASSGGIHLESIFIDEGFGSLDPEALDLALRTLLDLRDARRMVGIVSHVPELKEQIPARLEVVAGRSGSRAHFHLG
jgi:DNA repair protein SbcC/Rad50